jgi:LacI family transcriptional regulator
MPTSEHWPVLPRRRVALVVESSGASGREILRGIARYARQHGPWSLYHEPSHWPDVLPPWLARFDGDGIIARVRNRRTAARLARLRLPIVDVQGNVPDSTLPLVQVDDAAVAQLAAEHFFQRGFRNLACCGITGPVWAQRRCAAFVGLVEQSGRECGRFDLPPRETKTWFARSEQRRIDRWLLGLPKPVAIMAANDTAAQKVLDACRRQGLMVPEEVAVLGVDNDETLCEICDPMLSSIVPVHDQVGYRAAELLEQLVEGMPAPAAPIFLKPTSVLVRRSTDVLALDDRDVAAAVRFIRERACQGIGVEDVARHVALSYSTLQRRFHAALSRSVHDEILRVRIQRATELLAETQFPLARVAELSGFGHQEYLGAVFKSHLRLTPRQYRTEAFRVGRWGQSLNSE